MNSELQKIVEALPVIRQIVDDISYITVIDADSTVVGYAIPDGEKPMAEVGSEFKDPTGAYNEVLRTGVRKFNYLPKEVMGVAFEGVLAPIKDNGQTVGVITYTHSAENKDYVRNMTKEFDQAIQEIDEAANNMLEGIEIMFNKLTDMNKQTTDVESDVQDAASVVKKISSNASRSNILALNASIEAARSGEAGRGFTVVAKEMGKLSSDSSNSAKEIDSTLNTISSHLDKIAAVIRETNGIASDYMNSVNDVKRKLEKTMKLAASLQEKLD